MQSTTFKLGRSHDNTPRSIRRLVIKRKLILECSKVSHLQRVPKVSHLQRVPHNGVSGHPAASRQALRSGLGAIPDCQRWQQRWGRRCHRMAAEGCGDRWPCIARRTAFQDSVPVDAKRCPLWHLQPRRLDWAAPRQVRRSLACSAHCHARAATPGVGASGGMAGDGRRAAAAGSLPPPQEAAERAADAAHLGRQPNADRIRSMTSSCRPVATSLSVFSRAVASDPLRPAASEHNLSAPGLGPCSTGTEHPPEAPHVVVCPQPCTANKTSNPLSRRDRYSWSRWALPCSTLDTASRWRTVAPSGVTPFASDACATNPSATQATAKKVSCSTAYFVIRSGVYCALSWRQLLCSCASAERNTHRLIPEDLQLLSQHIHGVRRHERCSACKPTAILVS
jgi:hypothetical protein